MTTDDDGWVVLGGDGSDDAVCHPDLTALTAAMDGGTPAPTLALAYLPAMREPADDGLVAGASDGLTAVEDALHLCRAGWPNRA